MKIKYALIAIVATCTLAAPAFAGDLNGVGPDGCADLEERIAEIEATAAHKGNRKMTLTISGQINAVVSYLSLDGYHDTKVTQNGNDRSYVRFAGVAKINPDLSAGYVLEIDLAQLGVLGAPALGSTETDIRQSYWFIKSDMLGKLSLGKVSQATNDFDTWSTNSTWLAGKPHSLGALSDLYLSGLDLPFDGGYRSAVRYDSPVWEGFSLAATWASTVDAFASDGSGNGYDVALRYAHAWGEFQTTAAVGFRHDTDLDVNALNILNLTLPTGDVDTVLVNGSIKHVPTGIFVNASYANQDWRDINKLTFGFIPDFRLVSYDVQGGVEAKLNDLGPTTVFGEWGRFTFDPAGSASTNIDYYGLGVVQTINAAAMDVYVGYRHWAAKDAIGTDIDSVNTGARIKF